MTQNTPSLSQSYFLYANKCIDAVYKSPKNNDNRDAVITLTPATIGIAGAIFLGASADMFVPAVICGGLGAILTVFTGEYLVNKESRENKARLDAMLRKHPQYRK